jgi:phosphate transport system substrate-binding protein
MTSAGLARIYRGETPSWPDGTRVRLVMRPHFDVDTHLIRAISPELDAAVGQALMREGLLLASTNQECDEMVARTPGAIGPSTLTQLVSDSPAIRPLAWNGVTPTLENLVSGAYPLAKPFFLVIQAAPSRQVKRFLAFLGTPEARQILQQAGNLPVALAPLP